MLTTTGLLICFLLNDIAAKGHQSTTSAFLNFGIVTRTKDGMLKLQLPIDAPYCCVQIPR